MVVVMVQLVALLRLSVHTELHAAAPANNLREFQSTQRSSSCATSKSASPADVVPAVSWSAPVWSLCLHHAHNGLPKDVRVVAAPDCCAGCAKLTNCSSWQLRRARRRILHSALPRFGTAQPGVNCVSNTLAWREIACRPHKGDGRIRASVKTDDSQQSSGWGVLHALGRMVGIETKEMEAERVEGQTTVDDHRGKEDVDELYGHDGAWSHDWHEEHQEL